MELKNKNIILTGASSGIGYELAKSLAREGSNLVLIARREELLQKLQNEIKDLPVKSIIYKCDVSIKNDVKETFGKIRRDFDRIDGAILNAGAGERITIDKYSSEKAEEIFGANIMGLIYCFEELLSDLKSGGFIAGVSSLSDVRGFPDSAFYCASKAAASTFLESMRVELKDKIKVITIKPGFVDTAMTKNNKFHMPFLMKPERAAGIIISGIKKEKKIIEFPLPTVLGAKLVRLFPNFLFDFLSAKAR